MDKRRADMLRARREIRDAAGALFARLGYEGTTFSRIAGAMGRPKSVIGYHLFPSKAALAEAVLTAAATRWRLTVDVLDRAGAPRGCERLLCVLLVCARDVGRNPECGGAMRLSFDMHTAGIPTEGPIDWSGFARACLAEDPVLADTAPARLAAVSDLLLDATFGVVLCHAAQSGAGVLESRLGTLWTSLLQEAGVQDAAALVRRVVASPLLVDVAVEVDERLLEEEMASAP